MLMTFHKGAPNFIDAILFTNTTYTITTRLMRNNISTMFTSANLDETIKKLMA